MEAYSTVCGYGTGEIVEKKSRFIAKFFRLIPRRMYPHRSRR